MCMMERKVDINFKKRTTNKNLKIVNWLVDVSFLNFISFLRHWSTCITELYKIVMPEKKKKEILKKKYLPIYKEFKRIWVMIERTRKMTRNVHQDLVWVWGSGLHLDFLWCFSWLWQYLRKVLPKVLRENEEEKKIST